MFILGISCHFHDAASVLMGDGQLIAAAEEERFSRIKHDCNFPRNAIQFCLDQGGIDSSELSYVAFFEKPFRKLDRILMTALQTYPRSYEVFRESMIAWITDKLWITTTLYSEFGIPKDRVLFSQHHLSHAASDRQRRMAIGNRHPGVRLRHVGSDPAWPSQTPGGETPGGWPRTAGH